MSLAEEISELIAKYESYCSIRDQRQKETVENGVEDQHLNRNGTMEGLIVKSVHLLRQCQIQAQQLIELRIKSTQLQEANESAGIEIKSLKQHLQSYKQTIHNLSQNEQDLKLEIEHLHSMIANVQSQYENKHSEYTLVIQRLEAENLKLRGAVEQLQITTRALEEKNKEISSSKQELKGELEQYLNIESTLQKTIVGLKGEYENLTNSLKEELEQKQLRIKYLQQSKAEIQNEQSPEALIQEQFGWRDHHYDECFLDVPTEQKLIKLSEQVTLQENKLIHLNSLDSIEGSSRQQQKEYILKDLEQSSGSILRKVTSSIDFYRRTSNFPDKDIKQLQVQIPTKTTLQEPPSPKYQYDLEDISQIERVPKVQTNADTELTETDEVICPLKQGSGLNQMDPYYIHYLLIVQNIKIEEDEEGIYGILDIDMKPYFRQLKDSGRGISRWSEWIRQKLLTIHESESS